MFRLLVRQPGVSKEEHILTSINPDLHNSKKVEEKYKKLGYHTRWEELSNLDILH